jgi:hypothetical protein
MHWKFYHTDVYLSYGTCYCREFGLDCTWEMQKADTLRFYNMFSIFAIFVVAQAYPIYFVGTGTYRYDEDSLRRGRSPFWIVGHSNPNYVEGELK